MAWPYTYKWQKASKAYLAKHPLCVMHEEKGLYVQATVVDHKVPHRNDMKLFWDRDNWQGLCKFCHDSIKQRLEKSGVVAGCNESGIPSDPNHHWNLNR
ncbi:HNH endonuclease signature motif containing protein [Methylophaga sp.]|uniref:HNH endonuclease signature motif containing protein n=1 Tax=Methylophaga sp. TaxID=2024840 RepID=UPI003A9034E3